MSLVSLRSRGGGYSRTFMNSDVPGDHSRYGAIGSAMYSSAPTKPPESSAGNLSAGSAAWTQVTVQQLFSLTQAGKQFTSEFAFPRRLRPLNP